MRSGNKVSFKSMGSSPAKDMKTGSYEHSFESPAKQKKEKTYPEGYTEKDIKFLKEQREDVVRYEDLDAKGKAIWKKQGKPVPKDGVKDTKKKSPAKQYDYSTDVWSNIKKQGKKDKASNKAKKSASILAGDTGDITSNQELKQKSKTRKQKQRSVDSEGGRRRTRSERIKEKDTKLSEKLSQAEAMEARGEGKRGFSWKNAGMAVLEGQGLMGAARAGMGSGDYASTRIKAK